MKKLLVLALVMYATSCTNPEDRATGNPDSTTFNQSGSETNTNVPPTSDGDQSKMNNGDSSAFPSTSVKNADSSTQGTNRSYKAGGDSLRKK